jgi:hypothetical protein
MKSIHTLIPDVYEILEKGAVRSEVVANEIAREASLRLRFKHVDSGSLRLSKLGWTCPKAFWYSIHHPEMAEKLPGWAVFKFEYGHLIEALAVVLAKEAGHTVEGEQDELRVDGVIGHRDCVIDGSVVDVKSATSLGFLKFKDKSIAVQDDFGYLWQLDGYVVGSSEDPLVLNKDKGFLWGIDKQLGHMCLYEHSKREPELHARIAEGKRIAALPKPPQCTCRTQAMGKSGNIKLAFPANYNTFKHCCFPNLRTFLYSDGPVFLTRVERKPDVTEVDRQGRIVHRDF